MSIKDYGKLEFELDADVAPITVTNFINLVRSGLYDNNKIIRVQKDFVIATNQHDIVVTTAVALTDEQKERILALVAEKFGVKAGKLVENIDESILGGFVINVNNKVIDTSIRRQLQEFKMNLK
jgi:ATP synthase F1 delta subunit